MTGMLPPLSKALGSVLHASILSHKAGRGVIQIHLASCAYNWPDRGHDLHAICLIALQPGAAGTQ